MAERVAAAGSGRVGVMTYFDVVLTAGGLGGLAVLCLIAFLLPGDSGELDDQDVEFTRIVRGEIR